MKFLFVGTNPENTGAATHFVALAQALVEAGHQVSAVVYPDGMIAHQLASSKVRLIPATFRNVFDPRGYGALFAAIRAQRPDWLVGNFGKEYWPLIFASRLLNVPVALFRHRTPPMGRLSEYLVPRLAQRFIAVSNHARQAYLDRGVPAQKVQLLYNPVNMTQFGPNPELRRKIRRELGIADDATVIGYFGRLQPGKGIFTLLEAADAAMAQQPNLHCLWVGDGPSTQELRTRIEKGPFASRHHMLGWIEQVHPYYSAVSMLAFPSIACETFGRVSVEAQAAGIPVLGSDVGGVPETLSQNVTGLLLPPGNATAWRNAILRMCDPAISTPMARVTRDFVDRHFSGRVVAKNFGQLLSES